MVTGTQKTIDEIDDIVEMIQAINALGISCKGLKTLDQLLKAKVTTSLHQTSRFSLSNHHQNHSTNKVKNQRGKRRWIFKQCRKDSGVCNVSCGRYSKKCFTQIYKAMYEDAMFVSLWGAQIWREANNKNICHRVFYKEPVVVFWGFINIYMRTCSHARTVQIVKSQRICYFF